MEGSYWFMGEDQDAPLLGDLGIRRMAFGFPDSKDLTQRVTHVFCEAHSMPDKSKCLFTNSDDAPTRKLHVAAEKAEAGH
ncbi:unnamed protein product [Symbiodinium sp. CCMP2592]|nr:unnamed protein product [Symbiodinium sp. CCMP2592]